jgi:hypothetical protein
MTGRARLERALGYCAGLGALVAVLSPLMTASADSFPISTYPMFAESRGLLTLEAVVGVSKAGGERRLPPAVVASAEVLQTKVMIAETVARGPAAMAELCAAVAQRVAARAGDADLAFVDIVRRTYDPVAYFASAPTPISAERLHRCGVPHAGRVR